MDSAVVSKPPMLVLYYSLGNNANQLLYEIQKYRLANKDGVV
jgi:hypothetical protein